MTVDNVKNDSVVTLIPIHDVLKNRKPGAYVLIAQDAAKKPASEDDYSGDQLATQWVVDSDIALTSFTSANAACPGRGPQRLRALLQPRHAACGRQADFDRAQQQPARHRHHRRQWPRRFQRRSAARQRRRRAGDGDGLWPRRRFQLPGSAPLGLRPHRSRRRRAALAGAGGRLSLYRARHLSPGRNRLCRGDAARPYRRRRDRAADLGGAASRRHRGGAHHRCR